MIAAPKKKTVLLIQRLNAQAEAAITDEVEVARIEREAKALMNISHELTGEVFSILGMVACLRRDKNSMYKYHQAALEHTARSVFALENYANSLRNAKEFSRSFALAREAFQKGNNPYALELMILNSDALGLVGNTKRLLEDWKSHYGEDYSGDPVLMDEGEVREQVVDIVRHLGEEHSALWRELARV